MLAALVLALHDRIAGNVSQANRAVGLVDVLATGTAGAVTIFANILLFDIDLDRIINFRRTR